MALSSGQRLLLIAAVLIALATVVAAQSGRRGPTKSPVPAPEPAPSPTEVPPKPQTSERIQLLVGLNEPSGFDRIPLAVPETVLEACFLRLRETKEVASVPASRRMTRAEAIMAAKAETTRYVVLLEVRNERDDYGAQASNSNRLYLTFTIFEPGTAKIKKSGRAQHGTGKVGNVGVTVPGMGDAVYSEYAIKETARQAADRILDAFQIRVGGWPR